jgi:hypothetical protein
VKSSWLWNIALRIVVQEPVGNFISLLARAHVRGHTISALRLHHQTWLIVGFLSHGLRWHS